MGNWIPTLHRKVLPSSWKCLRSYKNRRRFSDEMLGLVGPGHYVTLGPTIRIHASAILWASPEQKFIRSFRRFWSTYETKFTPHIDPHMFILVKLFNTDICQQIIMTSTSSLPGWYRHYFTRERQRPDWPLTVRDQSPHCLHTCSPAIPELCMHSHVQQG
jgi:hypothetical protein